jgi:hypothetical protein
MLTPLDPPTGSLSAQNPIIVVNVRAQQQPAAVGEAEQQQPEEV